MIEWMFLFIHLLNLFNHFSFRIGLVVPLQTSLDKVKVIRHRDRNYGNRKWKQLPSYESRKSVHSDAGNWVGAAPGTELPWRQSTGRAALRQQLTIASPTDDIFRDPRHIHLRRFRLQLQILSLYSTGAKLFQEILPKAHQPLGIKGKTPLQIERWQADHCSVRLSAKVQEIPQLSTEVT